MKDKGEGSKTDRTVAPWTPWSLGVTSVTNDTPEFRRNHKQKRAPRGEAQGSEESRPRTRPEAGVGSWGGLQGGACAGLLRSVSGTESLEHRPSGR